MITSTTYRPQHLFPLWMSRSLITSSNSSRCQVECEKQHQIRKNKMKYKKSIRAVKNIQLGWINQSQWLHKKRNVRKVQSCKTDPRFKRGNASLVIVRLFLQSTLDSLLRMLTNLSSDCRVFQECPKRIVIFRVKPRQASSRSHNFLTTKVLQNNLIKIKQNLLSQNTKA